MWCADRSETGPLPHQMRPGRHTEPASVDKVSAATKIGLRAVSPASELP